MAQTLTFLCSGVTAAHKQGLFPFGGQLTASSRKRACSMVLERNRFDCVWSAPDPVCLATASSVGLLATPEPALAELDYGAWAGREIGEVMNAQPDEFARWLRGEFKPGNESLEDLFARVREWLLRQRCGNHRMIAVACPNVVRACVLVAMDLSPAHFAKLDILPLTLSTLTSNGSEWRLRSVGVPPVFSSAIDNDHVGDSTGTPEPHQSA